MKVIRASNAPVDFEVVDNIKDQVTPEALASARRTGCTLKGEFVTGIGRGSKPSINVDLRKSLSLYANVVHSFNVPGIASRCVSAAGYGASVRGSRHAALCLRCDYRLARHSKRCNTPAHRSHPAATRTWT